MEHPKAAWRVTSYEQVVDAVKKKRET